MYDSTNQVFRYQINKLRLLVNDWVNRCSGRLVLEVGCGDGYITTGFRDKEIVAFDLSRRRVKRAKERCDASFLVADGAGVLPFASESFEITIVAGVFEYVGRAMAFLEEVRRITKQGGVLILSFPNRVFLRRQVANGTGYREYALREVAMLLDSIGFSIDETTNVGLNWPESAFARPFQWLERWFPRFILTRSTLRPAEVSH